MAYKKSGTVSNEAIGQGNPKSILVTAKAAVTLLTIKSTGNSVVEFIVSVPANSSVYLHRTGELADRFPTADDISATIAGDSDSFVRIDF